MKPFSLNIIDNEIEISNKDGLSRRFIAALISISILVGVVYFFSESWIFFLFFIIIIITNYLSRRVQKDWLNLKQCIGKVQFFDDSIVISTLSCNIQLEKISHINLTGDYYQNYKSSSKDIVHNGLYDVSITHMNEEKIQFKFIVFNKQEFQELTDFFELLYSKFKINITEKIGKEQSTGFLLRHNRSYNELKELKHRLSNIQ